jgi:hypothetical protein
MSILSTKPVSQYYNYIKTRCHPDHLAVLRRFENIVYTKYKNQYVDYSEMRIPTSLGFIDIECNIYKSIDTDTVDITMVFIRSSVCYSYPTATCGSITRIEELGSEIRCIP